jgi:type II secretory pathway pseudopilin PulG
MRRHAIPRAGSAVIELLTVVAIIAMVLGLMLPALGRGREAARRAGCANNLRQLMLALQNYEESHRVLPPGGIDGKGPVEPGGNGLQIGWIANLLPFIEQRSLYDSIDFDVPVYAPANATVALTRITSLNCPSDPQAGTGFGISNYAGCHHDVEAAIDVDNHGVLYLNSRIRRADVHDGTSTTIYAGEKRVDPADPGGWMSGTRATLRNTGAAINAPASPDRKIVGGYSSHHRGGAHFGFGDGSVRWLGETIDRAVYQHLGNRDDGELIPGDAPSRPR